MPRFHLWVLIPAVGGQICSMTLYILLGFVTDFYFSIWMKFEGHFCDLPDRKPGQEGDTSTEGEGNKLIYCVTDVPPWYLCILLGIQVGRQSLRLCLSLCWFPVEEPGSFWFYKLKYDTILVWCSAECDNWLTVEMLSLFCAAVIIIGLHLSSFMCT